MFARRWKGIAATCLALAALASCGRHEETPPPPSLPAPAETTAAPRDTTPSPPTDTIAAKPPFDYDTHVGVAHWIGESLLCLEIANPDLKSGDQVVLVAPLARAFPAVARVIGATTDSCSTAGAEPGASHYTLRIAQGVYDDSDLAIALVGVAATPRVREGVMAADLDGDGADETFHECASREGIHLTIWTGAPGSGTRRWHRYVYQGMDLEPNCTEGEAAPAAKPGP